MNKKTQQIILSALVGTMLGGRLHICPVAESALAAGEDWKEKKNIYVAIYGMSNPKNVADASAFASGVVNYQTANDVTIKVLAEGGSLAGDEGCGDAVAIGATAEEGGKSFFQNDVFIESRAVVRTKNAPFRALSLWSVENGSNYLANLESTHQLVGDVQCQDQGYNYVALGTPDSYLVGNICNRNESNTKNGGNEILLANGGTWRPVYDNRFGTECLLGTRNALFHDPRKKEYYREVSAEDIVRLRAGGIIDLTWDGWHEGKYQEKREYRSAKNMSFRILKIGALQAAGGIVRLDSDLTHNKSDVLILGAKSDIRALRLKFNYDNFYSSGPRKRAVIGKALVLENEAKRQNILVEGLTTEYQERTYKATVKQDEKDGRRWNLTKIEDLTVPPEEGKTVEPSGKEENGSNILRIVLEENREEAEKIDPEKGVSPKSEGQNLPMGRLSSRPITENTKHAAHAEEKLDQFWLVAAGSGAGRMEELRRLPWQASQHDNVWTEYGRRLGLEAAPGAGSLAYTHFQGGYDKAFFQENARIYRGLLFSRIEGKAAFPRGEGELTCSSLGLYQLWQKRGGPYYQVLLTAGRMGQDYGLVDLGDNYAHSDYHTWGGSLSGEYGYDKKVGGGFSVTPNIGLLLGRVAGSSYLTSQGMPVYARGIKHGILSCGCRLTKRVGRCQGYVAGKWLYDFGGNSTIETGSVTQPLVARKKWWDFKLGGTVALGKRVQGHVEVQKLYGDLSSKLSYNLGATWSF